MHNRCRKFIGSAAIVTQPFSDHKKQRNQCGGIGFSKDVLFGEIPVSAGRYLMTFTPRKDAPWGIELVPADEEHERDAILLEASVDLGESGPNRLEYFFEYVSATERQLLMAWGGANLPISIEAIRAD
jgi:hypothetical protein